MMWYHIFKFEINYRIKRPETYIFFVFLFVFSMVGVDFVFQGFDFTVVKKNAPLIIAKTMGAITGFFMILASMIMGVPIIRDFEYNIESLMFVNPIQKRDYLLGRFLGSFAVLLFVFTGILFGMIVGQFMPWQDAINFNSFELLTYLQPFIIITLPALFFGACLFFVTGALSRKLVVVYTQGIILFVIFLLTKAITNEFVQSLLDPFSLTTLTLYTDTWTMTERNFQNIQFDGVLLYNKLFWMILGFVVLLFGHHKFNFSTVKSGRIKRKKLLDNPTEFDDQRKLPEFKLQYGLKAKCCLL